MPRVTTLRRGRTARYVVHLDGAYLGTLSEALVARHRLCAGLELSNADAEALRSDADREGALGCAYRLLGQRSRSVSEIRQRLAAKGYPEDVATAVVERLARDGLLDDAAFAAAYVSDKRSLSGWGNQRIATGLRHLGVDAAVIDEAVAAPGQGADDEASRALALLARLGPPRAPLEATRRRAFDRLRRRGFSAGIAQHAVREWLAAAANVVEPSEHDDTCGWSNDAESIQREP